MNEQILNIGERSLLLDKNGYLAPSESWSEDVCKAFATQESIVLTEDHWAVIWHVREFYDEYDTSPAIRALINYLVKEKGLIQFNSRYLQRLFPDGPAKQASKLAGLPKPAKCL